MYLTSMNLLRKILLLLLPSFTFGWDSSLNVDPNLLRFLLYKTPWDSQAFYDLRYLEPATLTAFNRSLPTTLMMDGYKSTFMTQMCQETKDFTLLHDGESRNVIILDYRNYTGHNYPVDYPVVCEINLPRAAQRVADMLAYLYGNEEPKGIHLIGHSLGAPLVAAIGRAYKKTYGRNITRITGLDPPLPYYGTHPYRQLKKGDADFVDIYHTDRGAYGVLGAIKGDVNIYINGGGPQPFCPPPEQDGLCSHWFSWFYFKDTYVNRWEGCRCEGEACHCIEGCDNSCQDKIQIGYHISTEVRGNIHVVVKWEYWG